ncbi:hypothetical protein L1049_022640 [Liquidambar formosana]|uniref:Response regulatory domain-containing protein n=1 Tax=Liquidambar formosana TaxID=63359 RepID=A0AAP0RCU3_LIQFO
MNKNDGHVDSIPVPEHVDNTQFPDGLRVLAIDDNSVCLRLLEALLIKCRYKVAATTNAIEALEMLRQNKDNFDIVITDVNNLDMDGFSLLDIIGIEMDLPVIMISADDKKSTVMKGIRHGARDYLLKPVRIEEIKNIWQHVVRKSLSDPNKSVHYNRSNR